MTRTQQIYSGEGDSNMPGNMPDPKTPKPPHNPADFFDLSVEIQPHDPVRITFFSPTEVWEVPYDQLRDWCAQHALNRPLSVADEMRLLWRIAEAYGSMTQHEGDRADDARREMEAAYVEWCRHRHNKRPASALADDEGEGNA